MQNRREKNSIIVGFKHVTNAALCPSIGQCMHGATFCVARFFSPIYSIKKHLLGCVWIVGATSTRKPSPEVAQLLNEPESITTFTRFLKDNYSKEYSRVKTRNSYTVGFRDGIASSNIMFGQILYFMIFNNQAMAIINVLMPSSSQAAFQLTFSDIDSRVFPVSSTTDVKAVTVENIVEKCIFVSVGDDKNFVARFCSRLQLDKYYCYTYLFLTSILLTSTLLNLTPLPVNSKSPHARMHAIAYNNHEYAQSVLAMARAETRRATRKRDIPRPISRYSAIVQAAARECIRAFAWNSAPFFAWGAIFCLV